MQEDWQINFIEISDAAVSKVHALEWDSYFVQDELSLSLISLHIPTDM